jgi:hypothetical protein
MATGCFLDKSAQPSEQEIAGALGTAFPLWQRLVAFMSQSYAMQVPLTFAGKNYGWHLWYRQSGKSLTALFPQQGYLVAQVVLGRQQVEKAMTLALGPKVSRLLRETPQLHDGKWLFIPVQEVQDAVDVEQLILLKKRPVRKKTL